MAHRAPLPLIRQPNLCWGLVFILPLALWACQSPPPNWPLPQVGQQTDFFILLGRPGLEVDILFLINNSPSMASRQTVLAQNFPRMFQVLQFLPGGLPDVHIGVVSSDMGAGTQPAGENWRYLGDRGLFWGNDPSPGAMATVAGGLTNGCGLNPGARWIEDIWDPHGFGRKRNYTGEVADVFSCLATAVGVGGSSYPHPLQALRVALNPQTLPDGTDLNMANVGFLRSTAYLFIVLIADEDDCSADPDDTINNGIFQAITPGETARLRCAARGHVCDGQPIPDYDPAAGYMGRGFTADFASCAAKDQLDPSHPDPAYLPLIRVQDVIDSVNAVKTRPEEQILVSGIIGWPTEPDHFLPGVQASNQYQIGKDSTALSPQDALWDYVPICEVSSIASADGSQYKAYGGLRLKQFVDAFGAFGQTFSICDPDSTNAMTQIGNGYGGDRRPGCIASQLVDTDPSTPEIQPECQAILKIPCEMPGQGDCLSSGYREALLPECKDPLSGLPLNPADPRLGSVSDDNRPCWYLYYDTSPTSAMGCGNSSKGQRITVFEKTGQMAPPGSMLTMKCWTCPDSDQPCTAQSQ